MSMKYPRKILVEEGQSSSFRQPFYYLALESFEYVTAVITAKSKSDKNQKNSAPAKTEGKRNPALNDEEAPVPDGNRSSETVR